MLGEVMHEQINVLDHGYVRLVEAWGHGDAGCSWSRDSRLPDKAKEGERGYPDTPDMECGIIEAARQSTQASFRGWENGPCPTCKGVYERQVDQTAGGTCTFRCPTCADTKTPGVERGDQRLLAYLFNGKPQHATPFEFAGMVIEVQAPIFVFREWHRHRTQSYNEMSARYAPLPDLNYVPTVDRLLRNSKTNKQAGTVKGSDELTEEGALQFRHLLGRQYAEAEGLYQDALRNGVPKELARVVIPVGRYSKMRASTCLRNWLAFCTLRSDQNAQEEIRLYSQAVEQILAKVFPRTYDLFLKRRG